MYSQMPDIITTNATDVLKPPDNGLETVQIFDRKGKGVMLVEKRETFSACLFAGPKET